MRRQPRVLRCCRRCTTSAGDAFLFTADLPQPGSGVLCFPPLQERLRCLRRGSWRIAYIYPKPNLATFRYRVLNMIEALAANGVGRAASWFSAAELRDAEPILDQVDVIVLCHCKYTAPLAALVARARMRGQTVLFDIDDLVFDHRYVQLILDYLDHRAEEADMDYWFADFGRYGALLRLCDGVIVTNAYLAERVQAFCALPVAVLPNFMNGAQLEYSARILEAKRATDFQRDQHVHLGYFSGSPTHQRDFAVVADAIAALMESEQRIILRLVGQIALPAMLAPFAERVEQLPMQRFLALQRRIGEVEINLVPLLDNSFTNSKSELKVFEAAAVGTISVVSPLFTLRRAVSDGKTGYLARSHEWLGVLRRALAELDDYPAMAEAAAAAALSKYTPQVQGPAVARTLTTAWYREAGAMPWVP